ncbi:MAG: VOC family protein [Leucobacter sp.]
MPAESQLFAGLPVRDLASGLEWYAAFFGRSADEIVGDEAMWQVSEHAWLFIAPDPARAGGGLVTLGVEDLDPWLSRWGGVGIGHKPLEAYGNGVRHVTVLDPDGNSLSLAAAR